MMTAKLQVSQVFQNKDDHGKVHSVQVRMMAVTTKSFDADGANDDNSFARWTPSAELTMLITNPALLDSFTVGQQFYVNFGDASTAAPTKPEEMAAPVGSSPIPTDLEVIHGKVSAIKDAVPSLVEGINNCWQGLIGLRTALENHVSKTDNTIAAVVNHAEKMTDCLQKLADTLSDPMAEAKLESLATETPVKDTVAASSAPALVQAPIVPAEPQNLQPSTQITHDQTPS